MRLLQLRSDADTGVWAPSSASPVNDAPFRAGLVLAFGDRRRLVEPATFESLRSLFPHARIVLCSGGAIAGTCSDGDGVVATAVDFGQATVAAAVGSVGGAGSSYAAGAVLARRLPMSGLRHVLVFGEGLDINGSALVNGISSALPEHVTVSGGLAGDGEAFAETVIGVDEIPRAGQVALVGFYGDNLRIGIGTFGGWEPFGGDRVVTKSEGNVVYEIDGRRALDLYKELLGPLGYGLPASGLMFPLKVRAEAGAPGVIRTILGVNETEGSLTFAGDVPQGRLAMLMRTDLDALIAGSRQAARLTLRTIDAGAAELVLAVSCIGRKLLLQRRVNEELVGALQVIGVGATMAGFYSYGEIAPAEGVSKSALHNQTMTLTSFAEA